MSPHGYSGTPLSKKLGIVAGNTVTLLNAPSHLLELLSPIPEDVQFRRALRGSNDLVLWFVAQRSQLERRAPAIAKNTGPRGLWIAWPKQTSSLAGNITQDDVRRVGLAQGLVDNKICAIDQDWSGLRFAHRQSGSPAPASD